MLLKDIIQAPKTNIQWGAWKSGAVMPRTQFPMSKGSFRIRKAYSWSVSTFDCLGQSFRLLVFHQIAKEEYGAWLAQIDGKDGKLLARLEFHATHPGWHIHTTCDTDHTPAGRTGGGHYVRFPKSFERHRRTTFGITGNEVALYKAAEVFRIIDNGNGLFGKH